MLAKYRVVNKVHNIAVETTITVDIVGLVMPGNRNSGCKKKIVVADITLEHEPLSAPPSTKKEVGRPRKDEIVVTDEIQNQQSCVSTVIHQRPHKTLQIHDLTKRTSDTSVFYDTYVGPSLDKFPSSKLPHKRVVLHRYGYLLASDTKYTRNTL